MPVTLRHGLMGEGRLLVQFFEQKNLQGKKEFNNKIKDSNLSSEARKLKQEVNKLLDLPNL